MTGAEKEARKLERVFNMTIADIYPLYVQKIERKDRTVEELDEILEWLTGYDKAAMEAAIAEKRTLRDFFAKAPSMNANAGLIKGVICGYRVEEIENPLMQQIRWMDKIVDELAKGKKLEKIMREA